MKFGILGAMSQEVALMARSMTIRRTVEAGMRTFYEGEWAGREVVLVQARVGKVAAAISTMLLLEKFEVTHIVFSGVAGAIDPRLKIGDIVLAEGLIQHDMDASPLFPRFEIPLLGKTEFEVPLADESVTAAERYLHAQFALDVPEEKRAAFGIVKPSIHRGLIVSGDQFLADPAITQALRNVLPRTLCTEMEGAAVAQVCHEMNVPFAVIRVISDQADHSAHVDFWRFVEEVAEHLTGGIVREMLVGAPANTGQPVGNP